jgi:hypothetical protein
MDEIIKHIQQIELLGLIVLMGCFLKSVGSLLSKTFIN